MFLNKTIKKKNFIYVLIAFNNVKKHCKKVFNFL